MVACALALFVCGSDSIARGGGSKSAPNILLLTLDTTRPDHLGCYGAKGDISPNLDALCKDAVVHTRAYSTSSWTLPAHASLFTGRFPKSHGARYDAQGPLHLMSAIGGPPQWRTYRARGLAPELPTLATLLASRGYATGAVVAGPWMKALFGLDRGFESYDDEEISSVSGRRAQAVTDRAIAWLRENSERPFLLFLNYYDPHAPYEPPAPFANRLPQKQDERPIERNISLYDGEIAYMDHEIGRLLASLEEQNLDDSTMIVVTADHGELFGEHGIIGHGHLLSEEDLLIPLIVRWPFGERPHERSAERIQILDIFDMILRRVGIEPPAESQAAPPPSEAAHPIVAEVYPLPHRSRAGSWRVIFDGKYKLHWSSRGNHKLHDLESDPNEAHNLYSEERQRAAEMMAALNAYLESLPKPPAADGQDVEVDAATRDALRGLGYID